MGSRPTYIPAPPDLSGLVAVGCCKDAEPIPRNAAAELVGPCTELPAGGWVHRGCRARLTGVQRPEVSRWALCEVHGVYDAGSDGRRKCPECTGIGDACPECGEPVEQSETPGRPRRFCTDACRKKAHAKRKRSGA